MRPIYSVVYHTATMNTVFDTASIRVKPWFNPGTGMTPLVPLSQTQTKVDSTWGGSEFKGLYALDMAHVPVPLHATGTKNIQPPPSIDRMFVPPPKWDPVAAGVHILETPRMPHAFCPVL